jgi:hypothetical protein
VPKRSDVDIRLCVEMRVANTSVKRVGYPIPTIDELLQDMNSSKIFSKLDVAPQDSYSIFKTFVVFFLITNMDNNIVHNIMDPFTTL